MSDSKHDTSEIIRADISTIKRDNARLRAALKPVLEVYISQDDNSVSVYDSRLDAAFALNAVREAKRIYNEGEERIAPPRNCDVGTADEQKERFRRFCLSRNCSDCQFGNYEYGECSVYWSQMPYEEGGAE